MCVPCVKCGTLLSVSEADQEVAEEALLAKQLKPGAVTPIEVTPAPSKNVMELLRILEFNQVDMYRFVEAKPSFRFGRFNILFCLEMITLLWLPKTKYLDLKCHTLRRLSVL